MRRKGRELVGMGAEGKSREFGDLSGRALREFGMRVQSRAHCGSSDGQVVEAVERLSQSSYVTFEQAGPAAKFLPECQRYSVLQMSAADLDHIRIFAGLRANRFVHLLYGRNECVLYPFGRRNMHRGREGVVGGLREVDVIIRMDRLLRSHHSARELNGAVGDDLVDIHIGLRAAARLPDAQGKLVVPLARDHLVGGLDNQLGLLGRELAQILVHQGAGLLEQAKGADQFGRHPVAADREMKQRPLGLRAPIDVCRDFDRSHTVGFGAGANRLFFWRGHGVSREMR